jgi:hypothetical protein
MAKFVELLLAAPEVKPLLSSEHFSFDGTLLRTWASHSSLERIDGSDDDPPPPNGGKKVLDLEMARVKREPRVFSAVCYSPTKFIARELTGRPRCCASRTQLGRSSATWATASWTTGTDWRWPVK